MGGGGVHPPTIDTPTFGLRPTSALVRVVRRAGLVLDPRGLALGVLAEAQRRRATFEAARERRVAVVIPLEEQRPTDRFANGPVGRQRLLLPIATDHAEQRVVSD